MDEYKNIDSSASDGQVSPSETQDVSEQTRSVRDAEATSGKIDCKTDINTSDPSDNSNTAGASDASDNCDFDSEDYDVNGNDGNNTGKRSWINEIFDYFEIFVVSACVVLVMFSFFTRLCRVDGPSMENTLFDGEMLIISDVLYTPHRGDIVVFHQTATEKSPLNEPIVKRVIATEGEWINIEIEGNRLVVTIYDENKENPVILKEDYAKYSNYTPMLSHDNTYPMQVPDGCIFVLGDNRNDSTDSRREIIGDINGCVDARRVLGKVVIRLSPLNKFGAVD